MTSPSTTETQRRGEESHRTKGLLRLTMACNERCPFCNVPVEDYPLPTPEEQTTIAEVDQFIADGARTMTISGGEPTLLRRRLVGMVARAKQGGIEFIELQTNAVLLKPSYAQELVDAGLTSAFVSFLSHIPELHDQLTGLEDSWGRCLDGIDALLDVGVDVTLNPVLASQTQELVADYIDFIAERLPRVRFVSMSAVQPHGRARQNLELLPDYAVLARTVREARDRAAVHGIEVVNPYCGLPLCVGWEDGLEFSVEAFEALGGGWRRTKGLDNRGNKAHGSSCKKCALRPRCGGAWHAYWEFRNGSGLQPPIRVSEPWNQGASDHSHQGVVVAASGPSTDTWTALESSVHPTVWVWVGRLGVDDAQRLLRSRCTDLALDVDPDGLMKSRSTLKELRQLVRLMRDFDPQQRIRIVIGLRPNPDATPQMIYTGISMAAALGVDGVRLLGGGDGFLRIAEYARREHPMFDVTCEDGTRTLDG